MMQILTEKETPENQKRRSSKSQNVPDIDASSSNDAERSMTGENLTAS